MRSLAPAWVAARMHQLLMDDPGLLDEYEFEELVERFARQLDISDDWAKQALQALASLRLFGTDDDGNAVVHARPQMPGVVDAGVLDLAAPFQASSSREGESNRDKPGGKPTRRDRRRGGSTRGQAGRRHGPHRRR
jgi:hypothetical protein